MVGISIFNKTTEIPIRPLNERFLPFLPGNGVENAFAYTKRIFTLSFHQYCPGFFPGSGSVDDCGFAVGQGYCANFPYKINISGDIFVKYFLLYVLCVRTFIVCIMFDKIGLKYNFLFQSIGLRVTQAIKSKYEPDVCIVQCGADAITGDPLGGTNLIPEDIGRCVKEILTWNLPTMFLGGGKLTPILYI